MLRKNILLISTITTLIALVGCADMASKMAGLGVVTEDKSTFDGATIVKTRKGSVTNDNYLQL